MSAPTCHRGHARCARCTGCQTCFELGDLGEWGCVCVNRHLLDLEPTPPSNVVSISAYLTLRNTLRVDLDDAIADLQTAAAQMGELSRASGASWELRQEATEGQRRVLETVRWLESNRALWRIRAEQARALGPKRGGEDGKAG